MSTERNQPDESILFLLAGLVVVAATVYMISRFAPPPQLWQKTSQPTVNVR